MNLAIYDDNQLDIENLKNIIDYFFTSRNMHYHLTICTSTKELLENVEKFDIIFLDLELGNENGIDIGNEINKISQNKIIIITSKHRQFLPDGYRINANRFLLKPIEQKIFDYELEPIIQNYCIPCINLKNKRYNTIKINEILYIESIGRSTLIHLITKDVIETSYTIKEWIEKFGYLFFGQSHKSYLVNFAFISELTYTDVILKNNFKIPLSRHYKQEFEKYYFDYFHRVLL